MSGEPVKLYLYDLSQGMARQMSMALTGKQIDGIWHTSVVVYDQEFYYGQGILTASPGTTHHGKPLQIFDMGETYLPLEVLVEYVNSQRSVFTAEKYHLLDFNCNTFSNDLCQFLTGQSIPSHIIDLPKEFLQTPFGKSLLPMIEGMFGKSQLISGPTAPSIAAPSSSSSSSAPVMPSAETMALLQGVSSAALSAATPRPEPVQIANNLSTLEKWIKSYDAVVVFFTSATCPPCRMIKPDFERLIEEKNPAGRSLKVVGVIVDTSVAYDAGAVYGIRSTPTFMLFHKGKKFFEFKGADYAELKSSVELLIFTAYPPHPHRKIQLRAAIDNPKKPILYTQSSNTSIVFKKLDEFITQSGLQLSPSQNTALQNAKALMEKPGQKVDLVLSDWKSTVETLLDRLPINQVFPVLDISRCLMVLPNVISFYESDCSQLVRILDMGYQQENVPKATLLMILRLASNLFASHTLVTSQFTSHLPSSHRGSLTQLLIATLLSQDNLVRQTAASLAFNCSTVIATQRLQKEENDGEPTGTADQEDDDWQVEIVSALTDALSKESDEEIVLRSLAAISNFLFLVPVDASLPHLLSALDIESILDSKKDIKSDKILGLAKDIRNMISQSIQS
ncbi:PPPDE putative peptidase domain-containing protein [Phycomyces nitens]|nr:PPPDE putative peptidase domain-containing protein [Phycomyces nitens]